MNRRAALTLTFVAGCLLGVGAQQGTSPEEQARINEQNAALKAMLQSATKFPLTAAALRDDDSGDASELVAAVSAPAGGGKDSHGRKPGHEHYGHDHK